MSARAGDNARGRDVSPSASSPRPRPTARARSLDSSDRRSVDAHARTSLSRGRVDSDTLLSADSRPLTLFDEISADLASSGSDELADNPVQRVDSSPSAQPSAGLEASRSADGPPSEGRTRSRSASVGAEIRVNNTHQQAEIIPAAGAQATQRVSLVASPRWVEHTPRPAITRVGSGAQAVFNPGFVAQRSPVQTPFAIATDQPAVSPPVPTQGLTAGQQAAGASNPQAHKHGNVSRPAATSAETSAQTTPPLGSVAPRSHTDMVGSDASRSPTDAIQTHTRNPRAPVTGRHGVTSDAQETARTDNAPATENARTDTTRGGENENRSALPVANNPSSDTASDVHSAAVSTLARAGVEIPPAAPGLGTLAANSPLRDASSQQAAPLPPFGELSVSSSDRSDVAAPHTSSSRSAMAALSAQTAAPTSEAVAHSNQATLAPAVMSRTEVHHADDTLAPAAQLADPLNPSADGMDADGLAAGVDITSGTADAVVSMAGASVTAGEDSACELGSDAVVDQPSVATLAPRRCPSGHHRG